MLLKLFLESKIHYVLLIETQIKANTGLQAVKVVCTRQRHFKYTRDCRLVIQNPVPEYFVYTSIFNILANLRLR